MAGIFSIFSEPEYAPVAFNKSKQHSKLKSSGSVEMLPGKMMQQPQIKPKGLSIRSKSDLNVPTSNNFGANRLNPKDCKMIKDKQCLSAKPVSPIKLLTPKKKIENYVTKKLSPKISSPIMQNVVDDFVFVKPATPKDLKKPIRCPEPEKLAYFYDPDKILNDEIRSMFEEDALLLKPFNKSNDSIVSIEDDSGFISDPGFDTFEYSIETSPSLPSLSDIELPDISDCED